MAMTKEERGTKNWLYQHLLEEGYRTYAKLFWELDFHLTANPNVVGYMDPKTGTITVNRTLEADQISVIIRHEILHGFLQHEKRLLQNLAQKRGLDPDDLSDMDIQELKSFLYQNSDFNIAGDYEISNLGYTEEDKDVVRNILLNGKTVSGLVTEDQHPDWVDLSIEEMYDRLQDNRKNDKQDAQQQQRQQQQSSQQDQSQSSQSGSGQNQEQQPEDNEEGEGSSQSTYSDQPQDQDTSDNNSSSDEGNSSESSDEKEENSNEPEENSSNSDDKDKEDSSKKDKEEPSDSSNKDNSSEKDAKSNNAPPKYVYGKFIDKNTFLDANGNIVTIG